MNRRTLTIAFVGILSLNTTTLVLAQAKVDRDAAAVRDVWIEYLDAKEGRFAANAGTHSPLWSATEQQEWPIYDLAGFYLPDDAVPEIVSVKRMGVSERTYYQIVTRFWPDSAAWRERTRAPSLTMTVFVRREQGQWRIANALRYSTARWKRQKRGRIAYYVTPSHRFSDQRANRAAQFVDSLAEAMKVTAPRQIDYYVCESVDQCMEIIGAVVPDRFGAAGGFSKPINRQVFSGIPALGEEYRHELAHVVLMPIIQLTGTSLLASEGVPTWLGGTGGRNYRESVVQLDSLLHAEPRFTLDSLVDDHSLPSALRNAAGAVLADMLHEEGGIDALRRYLQAPDSQIRVVLAQELHLDWPRLVAAWRSRVSSISRIRSAAEAFVTSGSDARNCHHRFGAFGGIANANHGVADDVRLVSRA